MGLLGCVFSSEDPVGEGVTHTQPRVSIVSISYQYQPTGNPNKPKQPESIRTFFDAMTSQIKNKLHEEIKTISWIDIDDVYLSDTYQKLPDTHDPLREVVPTRYRKLKINAEQADHLCQEAHLDALIFVETYIDQDTEDFIAVLTVYSTHTKQFKAKISTLEVSWPEITEYNAYSSHEMTFTRDEETVTKTFGKNLENSVARDRFEFAFKRWLTHLVHYMQAP
jgi:hypothetical protein